MAVVSHKTNYITDKVLGLKYDNASPEIRAKRNTVRHAIGQAAATMYDGAGTAQIAGESHEADQLETDMMKKYSTEIQTLNDKGSVTMDKNAADELVDMFNNQTGREIGEKTKSLKEIALKVLDEFANGGLLQAVELSDKENATISKTSMSTEELEEDKMN
jgi:hypothetical protein